MMSLRLAKFFGAWLLDYAPEDTTSETGLDRFICSSKTTAFIGRNAAEQERANGPARKLAKFGVAALDAKALGYEPIWHDGVVVGFCRSGRLSHHSGKFTAPGYPLCLANDGLMVAIEILGQRRPARLITHPPFDADGARVRG